MCGVVGIIDGADGGGANENIIPALLTGLRQLEYRGYDSAGIALIQNNNFQQCRATGKLINLENKIKQNQFEGDYAIGHTRWATHGAPTENNAHPHIVGNVGVVHNGIIENLNELKSKHAGTNFKSDTDTEMIAHLLNHALNCNMSYKEALYHVTQQLEGVFSFVALIKNEQGSKDDNVILAAAMGTPIIIGKTEHTLFIASDPSAIAAMIKKLNIEEPCMLTWLEEEDHALLRQKEFSIFKRPDTSMERDQFLLDDSVFISKGKGRYKHFMEQEIHDQPEVVGHALAQYLNLAKTSLETKSPADLFVESLQNTQNLLIVGCGTAYYAAMIAQYWFEDFARIDVRVDMASEFRYRKKTLVPPLAPPLAPQTHILAVSQSGETIDTIAALRHCKKNNMPVTALVNATKSTMAREADNIIPIYAGAEIAVASTKAFLCQLSVLAVIALKRAKKQGHITNREEKYIVSALGEIPRHIAHILRHEKNIADIAHKILAQPKVHSVFYIGRGIGWPVALEGALKLKELSYIHAEAYPAGELKHGPIALIEAEKPVIIIAPDDSLQKKIQSNIAEIHARGGHVILIGPETNPHAHLHIPMPETYCETHAPSQEAARITQQIMIPILYTLPVQLLAYHAARAIGADVDQPRNLAKSVTVE